MSSELLLGEGGKRYLWVTVVTSHMNIHYLHVVEQVQWLPTDRFIHVDVERLFKALTAADQGRNFLCTHHFRLCIMVSFSEKVETSKVFL